MLEGGKTVIEKWVGDGGMFNGVKHFLFGEISYQGHKKKTFRVLFMRRIF
jgi:hypothetical protein